ncbi:MAG: hypothetical protein JSS20_06340 [Proteobacteria bacterium]|nr:hypothetical protein [Pseudomonadota bacterium]
MTAEKFVAIWGLTSIAAAVIAGLVAAAKNRNHSWWAAWSFFVPPMLLILLVLGYNNGPRQRPPSLDQNDRGSEWI